MSELEFGVMYWRNDNNNLILTFCSRDFALVIFDGKFFKIKIRQAVFSSMTTLQIHLASIYSKSPPFSKNSGSFNTQNNCQIFSLEMRKDDGKHFD